MQAPMESILSRLEGVKPKRDGWIARCPVPGHGQGNGDRHQSLSVAEAADGRVLLKCHAGCGAESIVSAVGMTMKDLFPEGLEAANRSNGNGRPRIVATYDYRDADGQLQYQVVRYEPKDFRQRRPDGGGGWIWNVGNTQKVLFRLPELLAADPTEPVLVTEGEKDVLALVEMGLVATTNAGGVGKWRGEYTETLRDRQVVILPDHDHPGLVHAEAVARSLQGRAASVKLVVLPNLPEKGDPTDWIAAGGTREELTRLVEETPEWTPPEPEPDEAELPTILISNRQLRDMTDDAMRTLRAHNDPPRLFERGGELCRVRRDENDRPVIEAISEAMLRGELERSANYRSENAEGHQRRVAPPLHVVRDVAALPEWGLPPLEAITEVPVLRPDGTVLNQPGYDAQTRLYYSPAPGLTVPPVPVNPTKEEVTAALSLVAEVIREFPFVDDASFTNALALMLTPVMRPVIRGPVPMGVVDAPQKGTGKTLLAEAVAVIATGKAETMGAPRREEEWQKLTTSALAAGMTFIIIDNLRDTVRSGVLERVLTSPAVVDRILGASRLIHLPQRATWVATANNVDLSGDLSRRCYWMRIDAQMAQPWLGRTFDHPDLLAWVQKHRGELIAALLTLARSWYAAGCPKPTTPKLGKFEAWCNVVGGVLQHVGDANFLGNLDAMYEQMDESAAQWEGFLRAWWDLYGARTRTVSQLVSDMNRESFPESVGNEGENLRVLLPDELVDAFVDGDDKKAQNAFSRKLGHALKKRKDVRYGDEGLHLERVGTDTHKGATEWRVTPDAGSAGSL